jgi:hypothetical protein
MGIEKKKTSEYLGMKWLPFERLTVTVLAAALFAHAYYHLGVKLDSTHGVPCSRSDAMIRTGQNAQGCRIEAELLWIFARKSYNLALLT